MFLEVAWHIMFSAFARLLALTCIVGVFSSQAVWAQSNDIGALSKRSVKLYEIGEYAKAAALAKRVLALTERRFGPKHLQVGTSLTNLAILYTAQGRYAEAEPLYKRGLMIRQKALGRHHPDVAATLNNFAGLYKSQARYREAEPLYKRGLAIREKTLGRHHPHVATSLNDLAGLYQAQGRYAEVEPLLKRSLVISRKALGRNHPDVSSTLNNLAFLYNIQGRYAEAEPLLKRSLVIAEKTLGRKHPDVASTLNNLALLYDNQGRYSEAETVYKRSLAIKEKAFGPEHPSVATALNSLASIYERQARYQEAESLRKRGLAIKDKVLGRNHPDVARVLDGLAVLYESQGRSAEAKSLHKRSLAIKEKALGPEHPSVATSLNNLAVLYERQGRSAEAKSFHKRSLTIKEKALGPEHPSVATSLNNLAMLYERQGGYAEADPLYKRSLAIWEKTLGRDHPSVAIVLNNLAGLHFEQMHWVRAVDYFRRAADVIVLRKRRETPAASQSTTRQKKKTVAARSSLAFSVFIKAADRLARQQPNSRSALAGETFRIAQWASGSEAAASLAQMAARQATGDGDLARLVRERQDLVAEWQKRDALRSTAVARLPAKRNKKQEAENVYRLDDIDRRILIIDKRLATDFPDYAELANPEPLTITQVQDQLKGNEALVLFLDVPKSKPTPEETFIWVVTKTASRWGRSDVGPKGLRDHVDALRCGLDFEGAWKGTRCFDLLNALYSDQDHWAGKSLPFSLNRAYALYKSMFGQVEDLIAGKDLLVVPSGPLTQLPFQVLVTEKPENDRPTREAFVNASWLTKHHAITVLPSVSSLKALRAHAKTSRTSKPFIGFGNPLLDGDTQDHGQRAAAEQARSIQGCAAAIPARTTQLRFARKAVMPMGRGARLADLTQIRSAAALPETADEVCAVGRTAGASTDDIYLGHRATEAGIKALSQKGALTRYKVVHFATHGALAGELKGSNEPGLILSPPKLATTNDDGYLSASEVAGLKLDADWVILSACNTAGGGASSAEALSGLARAFFYAGARSLLVSHWYVDSQATVALITKAFDELKRDPKIRRAGALRQAMLTLMKSGKRTWHPAYWAPFVVVGEGAG